MIEYEKLKLKVEHESVELRLWGNSMYPSLCQGEMIRVTHIDWRDLKVGDIILIYNKYLNNYICHRIVDIRLHIKHGFLFYTKGDNSTCIDHRVTPQHIIGKVEIAKNGYS